MEERPEQLQKRFLELAERAYQNGTYVFTPFLGIQEQSVFYKMEKMLPPVPWEASGGMNGCERRMVRFGSEGLCGYEQPFPIACIAVRPRSAKFAEPLTHRDFLGALMGCGVKRETVGDIYVAEGRCDFLVTREVLPYLLQNFLSAGRTKLHAEQIALTDVSVPEQKTKMVRDTVPSLRLDGIVSSGFSISRGKAADYISAGKCELNYTPCVKGDKQTTEGDVITVRGLGKIRLDTIGSNTKKGRIGVEITRFL